jgi:hypothetical protein
LCCIAACSCTQSSTDLRQKHTSQLPSPLQSSPLFFNITACLPDTTRLLLLFLLLLPTTLHSTRRAPSTACRSTVASVRSWMMAAWSAPTPASCSRARPSPATCPTGQQPSLRYVLRLTQLIVHYSLQCCTAVCRTRCVLPLAATKGLTPQLAADHCTRCAALMCLHMRSYCVQLPLTLVPQCTGWRAAVVCSARGASCARCYAHNNHVLH